MVRSWERRSRTLSRRLLLGHLRRSWALGTSGWQCNQSSRVLRAAGLWNWTWCDTKGSSAVTNSLLASHPDALEIVGCLSNTLHSRRRRLPQPRPWIRRRPRVINQEALSTIEQRVFGNQTRRYRTGWLKQLV